MPFKFENLSEAERNRVLAILMIDALAGRALFHVLASNYYWSGRHWLRFKREGLSA